MCDGQFLLILGVISVIATYFITEYEFAEEEEAPVKQSKQRAFYSQTFEEMNKGETFNW